jgi:hypothetical protein
MKIRMPAGRAFYPASRNEPNRLLCWIPRRELEQLAAEGRVRADVLEYYPSGLEVRVSWPGFDEFGLNLGIDPDRLYEAYQTLRQAGALPESGVVAGADLEQAARSASGAAMSFSYSGDAAPPPGIRSLPEPEWTDGEDARAAMGKLR